MQTAEKLLEEVRFRFSRSQGKGGQHVNKVETRVEILFDVSQSAILTGPEKERIFEKLASRINKEGILMVDAQSERSQYLNKEKAQKKFLVLLNGALQKPKKRKPVKPLKADEASRLKQKRAQSEKKSWRSKVFL